MQYAIPLWDPPAVPVVDGAPFPVRHIFCVGRNYAEHAKEMGGDAAKEPPFFFTKPADAIVPVVSPAVGKIRYPMATRNFHHELELVVAIGRSGTRIAPADAQALVYGYAVGLDMTRRDLQNEMREKKRPWDIGKSFAQAAPIAPIHPAAATGPLTQGEVTLEVNGQRRQTGSTRTMIFSIAHQLSYISQFMVLEPGDVVTTGTPPGVALGMKPPVWLKAGDVMTLRIEGLGEQKSKVIPFKE